MTTNEQTCLIRIDIDGEKHRLQSSPSTSAAELRNILSERYHISLNTLFPGDEQSITIGQLLTENNVVRLITDKSKSTSIPVPEMNFGKKLILQILNHRKLLFMN